MAHVRDVDKKADVATNKKKEEVEVIVLKIIMDSIEE